MQEVTDLEAQAKQAADAVQAATAESKREAEQTASAVAARLKAAKDALAAASEQLKRATAAAQPKDIVDIVVTEPIAIHVKPAETK
jgi:hypothetical protein